ncbi:DUF3830 family protein [Virgibacillus sp. NKC19-3]|uniref:DUF3830 family protein n=1 Tax=Virgibacillus saliphilus TaxID=2831674 RepID=UPI001C9A3D44|nr:DUF3830 family protein [Virgibacillus sp. NKC19-3]MBY7144203.1 DUF3830 family protein [Virgibacillus sp. NKC19-3]
MKKMKITSGDYIFVAELDEEGTPETSKWFLKQLPMEISVIQAAWSGPAVFSDLNWIGYDVPFEKATSYPLPSQVVFYPGDEKGNSGEIYIPYGGNCFACPRGQLAGNPFLHIIEGEEQLPEFGKKVRHEGAQKITFEEID